MYATQLEAWSSVFEQRHLMVMQYEWAAAHPEEAVARVWSKLGIDGVDLHGIDTPSRSSTRHGESWSWELLPGFRETLTELYATEVGWLQQDWGIDTKLWPNYA